MRGAQSRETAGEWGGGLQFLDYENQSFLELGGEFSICLGLGFQFLGCICGLLGSMVSTVDVSRCF